MRFENYLTEKQIIISNGDNYGQIVFLAGGAGSGKGFASSNFIDVSKYKVRDVDEMKLAIRELMKLKGEHPEIANADLSNPEDVRLLHDFVKKRGIKNETLRLLLHGNGKEKLPNILFDVTMKDIGDIYEVVPSLFEAGYKTQDISLVWILTNYKIALKQNAERERVVPEDIMLITHEGAANTVTDLLRNKVRGVGTIINGSIDVVLNNRENTIIMTDQDTKETMKGKNKSIQMGGDKISRIAKWGKKNSKGEREAQFVIKSFKYIRIKDKGKPMKSSESFNKEVFGWSDLRNWIKANIPKTNKTKNIRQRKRV